MNRNAIVTILVIIVIAAATAGYLMVNRSRNAASPAETKTDASAVPSATATAEKTSLKDFMSMTGNQRCNFSDADTGNKGEVYVGDGKMRGDFAVISGGTTSSTHMVNDGTDVYIWMNDQKTGFKTSLSAMEAMSNQEGMTGVNKAVDLNRQVEYSCEGWTVDSTKFAVPVEVKFQDIGSMMKNINASSIPGASEGTNAAACAACDNLEGNQKNQCKTVLKCN